MSTQGPFFSVETTYPFLLHLTKHIETIRDEAERVSPTLFVDWPEKYLVSSARGRWTTIPIRAFGQWIHHFSTHMPETVRLLKEITPSESMLATVLISKVAAGTVLKKHQGYGSLSNHVLRCHLPLRLPSEGKCGMWVEDQSRLYQQSEWLVFDDSRLHSSFNVTDEERTILLVDITRPPWIAKGVSTVGATDELFSIMAQYMGRPDNSYKKPE